MIEGAGFEDREARAINFGRTAADYEQHRPGFPESFSYIVDVPFSHDGWRGRMRTCGGVGSSLGPEQVERFGTALVEMLAREIPGELSVLHRVFAASGFRA